MKPENITVKDLKNGYCHDRAVGSYTCTLCGTHYEEGEVYPRDGRFFEARRAMELHMQTRHRGYTELLIDSDSRYNTLTENQKALLKLFASGQTDKEIAAVLGLSASTVRHHKFMFREKARQARTWLAVYELVFESEKGRGMDMIPVHEHARCVDERYVVTEEERAHILATSFESMEPLKLRMFSPKEKKKVVILARIAGEFRPGQDYSEREVNEILKPIFDDYATLRRYLIQYGFMSRTRDGSAYRLT